MELKLVYYPDPRLRGVAQPVAEADDELRQVAARMFEVMYRSRGIGLAGPQVGVPRRIVVANLAGPEAKEGEQVFVNPQILERTGEMKEEEGCLSLPGMYAVIQRAERLKVRYQDLEGKAVERETQGLEAKLFQHEIDHLDGLLIIDKMTPADLKQWAALLKELEDDFHSKRPKARAARPRRSKSAL
jgi:peptide deformylase